MVAVQKITIKVVVFKARFYSSKKVDSFLEMIVVTEVSNLEDPITAPAPCYTAGTQEEVSVTVAIA